MTAASPEHFVLGALDHLDQGITVMDADLRLVMWNRHMVDLLEFPPALMRSGVELETLIRFNAERGEYGPGDPAQQVATRMQLARRFQAHCFERTRPNGRIIEVKGNPLAGGGFVTVYSDITERRRNESALREGAALLERRVRQRTRSLQQEVEAHERTARALRESEQWLRTIADNIPALIGYIDSSRAFQPANRRDRQWFGDPDRGARDSRRGRFLGSLANGIDSAFGGESWLAEVPYDDHAGRQRLASVALIPHRAAGEAPRGLFLLAQDITEYKAAQDALVESGKLNAVGELTGALAHDFGNMLAIIQGNLTFIEPMVRKFDVDAREAIGSCLDTAARGAELTRRLLAFARRQSLQPQAIDLGTLLEDLRALTRRPLGEHIEVSIDHDPAAPAVMVDPAQLEGALLNLFFNARDAMPQGGRIEVATTPYLKRGLGSRGPDLAPGRYVRVRVSDTGCGIPPGQLGSVMEPFFTTKETGAGTGLGLSTVYGFVKQSRGDIRISSRIGCGTRVEMYLPACSTATGKGSTERPG